MGEACKTAAELFSEILEPRDTRERILFAALDLFHEHGFHAVGLDRILNEVGVTKTTFCNHFESRDELMVEALLKRNEWDHTAFERRLEELAGSAPRTSTSPSRLAPPLGARVSSPTPIHVA